MTYWEFVAHIMWDKYNLNDESLYITYDAYDSSKWLQISLIRKAVREIDRHIKLKVLKYGITEDLSVHLEAEC